MPLMTTMEERLERIRLANAGKPKTPPKPDLPPLAPSNEPRRPYIVCEYPDDDLDEDLPDFLK